MYTNIFLIPVFVFISLIFFSNIRIKERLFEIFKISLLTLLILLPGLIALIIIETFGVREDSYQGFLGGVNGLLILINTIQLILIII